MLRRLQLTNAGIHALRHVFVFGVLRLWNIQQLKGELANPVRGTSYYTTTLALNTTCARVIHSPLVEAGNVDNKGTAIGLAFMVVETYIGSGKGAVGTDKVMKEVPGRSLLVSLRCCLCFLLLFKGKAFGLLLSLAFLLLSLFRRRKKIAEGGMRLLVVDRPDRCSNDLRDRRRLKLRLKSKLEFKIIKNDELKLLANRSRLTKFQPRSCNAVQSVVEGQLEPCALG